MSNRVQHITIVGGGTAGWMAAAMLWEFINSRSDQSGIEVTLIESPRVPTVGVGEATVPAMPRLLRQLGIEEGEFFRRCNASFKCAVRFVDWNRTPDGTPISFYNPFNVGRHPGGFNPGYNFSRFGLPAGTSDLGDALLPTNAAIDAHRGPRGLDEKPFTSQLGYAYHLDAGLFAQYLREISIKRGVRHLVDDVVEVEQDERGFITALQLERGGKLPVEFVLDCSGFRGLLINGALDEPFESYSDSLLCDRAIAVQVPHLSLEAIDPCTTSTALSSGWVWRVPLVSRIGTGYVFSSQFLTDQQAIDELVQHLTAQGHKVEVEPRAIAMRVGRTRRCWVNNCVAIGLSGGFIEPLESTAIFMIEMSMRWFIEHFPDRAASAPLARRYNRRMESLYNEVRDFIVMHYVTSNRDDSAFWPAARNDVQVPDSLKEMLELWRCRMPGVQDLPGSMLFNFWNYLFMLQAKGYFDGIEFPLQDTVNREIWDRYSA